VLEQLLMDLLALKFVLGKNYHYLFFDHVLFHHLKFVMVNLVLHVVNDFLENDYYVLYIVDDYLLIVVLMNVMMYIEFVQYVDFV
jgi:hypothetical protein